MGLLDDHFHLVKCRVGLGSDTVLCPKDVFFEDFDRIRGIWEDRVGWNCLSKLGDSGIDGIEVFDLFLRELPIKGGIPWLDDECSEVMNA